MDQKTRRLFEQQQAAADALVHLPAGQRVRYRGRPGALSFSSRDAGPGREWYRTARVRYDNLRRNQWHTLTHDDLVHLEVKVGARYQTLSGSAGAPPLSARARSVLDLLRAEAADDPRAGTLPQPGPMDLIQGQGELERSGYLERVPGGYRLTARGVRG